MIMRTIINILIGIWLSSGKLLGVERVGSSGNITVDDVGGWFHHQKFVIDCVHCQRSMFVSDCGYKGSSKVPIPTWLPLYSVRSVFGESPPAIDSLHSMP
jgi:hypothetical protein